MSTLSFLNPFNNPIVIKCARERLRPQNAISWGLVVTVVTGFVYFICYKAAEVQVAMQEETAAKFALVAILIMQGIILMLMGTGSVAIGIAQERMGGVLDYQRMTPMSPTSKIIGYLIGLPIREYFLFLLTMPYVLYAAAVSGVKPLNLIHLYAVGFVSVWLYHMTGMVAGMVSPKPWRAGIATQSMVLLIYFVMPQLSRLGFTFFLYLTPRPVFAQLAFAELGLDLSGVVDADNLHAYGVPFFDLHINPSLFTVGLQGFLIVTLFLIVHRKWREETQHPLAKGYALLVFAIAQVMLLGSLYPKLVHPELLDDVGHKFNLLRLMERPAGWPRGMKPPDKLLAHGIIIGEQLLVFFFFSMGMALLLVALITPSRPTFAKGLRRARKLALPRVPRLSDAATALPYAGGFIAFTCVSYALLTYWAVHAGGFFEVTPGVVSLLMPAVLFAALVLGMQAVCQRFGMKAMLMAMFIVWLIPFLTFALMVVANSSPEAARYVGAPMPINAFIYTIANLFESARRGPVFITSAKLTLFAVALNTGLAVVALSTLFKHQAQVREAELNPPAVNPRDICATCGYSLHTLSDAANCPECGASVGGSRNLAREPKR
jgi:hypothetical protein